VTKKRFSLSNSANVILASLVVVIMVLMIIPLPTFILDLLITLNIGMSVTLLLVALYVSEPLKIATFPSLLLLATMFRLGLNVASTRLILLQADAGAVIESFGQFVVAGNIIVGAVVFLILTLIQFLVIAKGSERVAEVAARFTLDAMPGRQMAIDAELRSGYITHEQAKKQRFDLHRESQLYGSMDGAMKFVKGDAIAGLIITAVNIIGGLAVGTLQMNMSGGEAVTVYSVLTVGDGLVSQIPSLFVSLSAGFIITRVASEVPGTDLGKEMGSQIIDQPSAITWVGVLLIGMGLIPGLPTIPFLLLGFFAAWFGYKQSKKKRLEQERSLRKNSVISSGKEKTTTAVQSGSPLPLPLVEPLIIELSTSLSSFASTETDDGIEFQEDLLGEVRSKIYWSTGVLLPPAKIRINSTLPENSYGIMIRERVVADGELAVNCLAVGIDKSTLMTMGIDIKPLKWSSSQLFFWIDEDESELVYSEDAIVLEGATIIAHHLNEILRKNIYEFVNMDTAQILVNALGKTHPALVEECFPAPVSLPLITEILKRLAEEGVSLRHMDRILSSLNSWVAKEADPVVLTEYVRMELKGEVSGKYASGGSLPLFLASGNTEEEVRAGITRGDNGSFLALDPDVTLELQQMAKDINSKLSKESRPMVVLASMDIRRYLRQILVLEIPDIVVLSYQELDQSLQIQPMGEL
jgi:type III secretion protein V